MAAGASRRGLPSLSRRRPNRGCGLPTRFGSGVVRAHWRCTGGQRPCATRVMRYSAVPRKDCVVTIPEFGQQAIARARFAAEKPGMPAGMGPADFPMFWQP